MDLATTTPNLRGQSRRYTKTNATNYPDATLDADINIANGEVWMMILEAEGYKNTGGDFKVIDLEDSTGLDPQDLGYNGEYPFPSIALALDEVFIDYGDGYKKADIIDKSEVESSMFNDEDDSQYTKDSPVVFVYRDSIFIRPIHFTTKVTDGIKMLVRARQDTLTETTDTPQFESNFHNIIPLKVAQDYAMIYPEKHNSLIDKKVQELESQIISFYQDRTLVNPQFKVPSDDRGLKQW
jgi:hypothetical protein